MMAMKIELLKHVDEVKILCSYIIVCRRRSWYLKKSSLIVKDLKVSLKEDSSMPHHFPYMEVHIITCLTSYHIAVITGVAGLYDYGPMGCAMNGNIISIWRSHFVLEDQLLEVSCSMLTPYPILK